MSITSRYHTDRAKLALELTMRDALAGVEELAYLDSAWSDRGCLEILSIEAPRTESNKGKIITSRHNAEILHFPEHRRRTG